jgi:hypothetical protein
VDADLLDQIESCNDVLDLFQDRSLWFSEYSALVDESTRRALINLHADMQVDAGVFGSRQDAIDSIDAAFAITNDSHALIIDVIEECASSASREYNEDPRLRELLRAFDKSLHDPATCVTLLSRRSFFETAMLVTREQARELRAVCLAEELWDYNTLPRRLRNRWPTLERFLDNSSGASTYVLDTLQEDFCSLFGIAKVATRHPLFATDYSLYVPPSRRLVLANPIDEIIAESARHPALIRMMSPREFEKFLKRIFEGFGYDVQLTAQTRDHGVDLLCLKYDHGIEFSLAVEAKRYAENNPVSVDLVRSFVGANHEHRRNKLVYVTTSRFTPDTRQYLQNAGLTRLVELKEFPDIVKWSQEHSRTRWCS